MASECRLAHGTVDPVIDVERLPASVGVRADPSYTDLADVKLGTVREAFSPFVHSRSAALTYGWLAFDATLYLVFIVSALIVHGLPLKLVFGLLAGVMTASLFVWAHDASHGALFGITRKAEILGTLAMLPSLQMYRLWSYGHNRVHHGFTSLSTVDWIWRPWMPSEYRAASRTARIVYRVERSLPGCGLHYFLRVWWSGMVRFNGDDKLRDKYHFGVSKTITAAFAIGGGAVAWIVGGGWTATVAVIVVPWVVFTYAIALIIYLHHTHPRLPFFNDRQRWNATIGQVACSTIVRGPRIYEIITHNISVHTPHHVDTRIPFYRLKEGYADLRAAGYGAEIVEYRFSWSAALEIFRTCKLFDFETQTWYRFSDLDQLPL